MGAGRGAGVRPGEGKGEWKRTPLRVGGKQGQGSRGAGSTHLGPEDTTVQSAGSLVVEKVKLQRAQGGWRRGKR